MTAPAAPPPLDRLLAHRAWVRRVARALVRDDASADDLAQDVWLDAISHPPRDTASPRGWLARALRHNAVDAGRADRRRTSREAAVARPEVARDGADLVAETEIHRRVVDAVLALPEPARGSLLLRFFEGLPPAAIAARQGVPVETVRTRIRRALADLRERFDREQGGDRRAWISALAPLTGGGPDVAPDGPPGPPGRAGPKGAPRVAPLVGAAAVAIGAAFLVALVLAVRVAVGPADDGADATSAAIADTSPGTEAAHAPPARAARPTSQASSSDAAGATPETPLPPDTWVAVHVIDEDLRAVSDATVSILVAADAPEGLRKWKRAHAVEGRNPFPLHGLPADADGWDVRLTATAPGRSPAEPVIVTLEADRTQVTRLVLSVPRTIAIRAIDAATGAPIGGARIVSRTECRRRGVDGERARAATGDGWATTGEDGTCSIGGLGRGKHDLFADPVRYLPARVSVTAGGADAVQMAFTAIPFPGRVRAVVRAPGGVPAAGVSVSLWPSGGNGPTFTLTAVADASGTATFDDLPPGRHFVTVDGAAVLRASPTRVAPEVANRVHTRGTYASVDLPVGGDVQADLGDVSGSAKFVVRVVGADGKPVEGALVILQPGLLRTTDAAGAAEFVGLREGDGGFLQVGGWCGPVVTASPEPKPVTWTLGGARIELVLRGPDGKPLPATATVQVVAGDRQCFLPVGTDGRRSLDVEGRLTIPGVPAGPLTLQAWGDGDRASFAVLDVPAEGLGTGPGGRVEVTLRPCGMVRVRAPQTTSRLTVRPQTGGSPAGSDAAMWLDGSVSVPSWVSGPLAAGSYVVEGTVAGAPFRREIEVREGETTVVE